MKIGKMVKVAVQSACCAPATLLYPFVKRVRAKGFRGMLKFYPEKCIGCKMCMRDCPSNAINIKKVGEKQFVAEINLGRCIYCAQCVDTCPKKALEATDNFELAQVNKDKLNITLGGDVPPKKPEGTA